MAEPRPVLRPSDHRHADFQSLHKSLKLRDLTLRETPDKAGTDRESCDGALIPCPPIRLVVPPIRHSGRDRRQRILEGRREPGPRRMRDHRPRRRLPRREKWAFCLAP